MPRFNDTKFNSSMNLEVCDFFEPKNKETDRICRYFTGNRDNEKEIEGCRHYCSIHESKQMMEDSQVLIRRHGALKQR